MMDEILAPIKQRILNYIDFQGIGKKIFFEKLGVAASNFRSSSLKSEVGGDVIAKISSNYPDLNIDWLITGNGQMLRTKKNHEYPENDERIKTVVEDSIPLYDLTATASIVEVFSEHNNMVPLEHIVIPNLPNCDGAIHITGDSMYPLLKSGDMVLFKKVNNKENIIWGEMYVLYINNDGDEFFFVKYVQKSKNTGYIKLVSQNQHHEPVEFPIESIKQLAIVKASIRINSKI